MEHQSVAPPGRLTAAGDADSGSGFAVKAAGSLTAWQT